MIDKSLEERYPGFDPEAEVKSGPFKIVWDTDTSTSHTLLAQKEIRISKRQETSNTKSAALAHEIAHSRLLKEESSSVFAKDPEQDKVASWRELEAVMYTLAKGQSTLSGVITSVLLEGSQTFGDGSLKDALLVARKVLERLYSRNYITEKERKKGITGLRRVSESSYREYFL